MGYNVWGTMYVDLYGKVKGQSWERKTSILTNER